MIERSLRIVFQQPIVDGSLGFIYASMVTPSQDRTAFQSQPSLDVVGSSKVDKGIMLTVHVVGRVYKVPVDSSVQSLGVVCGSLEHCRVSFDPHTSTADEEAAYSSGYTPAIKSEADPRCLSRTVSALVGVGMQASKLFCGPNLAGDCAWRDRRQVVEDEHNATFICRVAVCCGAGELAPSLPCSS